MLEIEWRIRSNRITDNNKFVGSFGKFGPTINDEEYDFWLLRPSMKREIGDKVKAVVLGEKADICFLIRDADYGDLEDERGVDWPTPFIHAERVGNGRKQIVVPYAGTIYEFVPAPRTKKAVEIRANGKSLGTIHERQGILRTRIICDLSDEVPLPVRVFMCMVHDVWERREA